jgi:hypothetical protein
MSIPANYIHLPNNKIPVNQSRENPAGLQKGGGGFEPEILVDTGPT